MKKTKINLIINRGDYILAEKYFFVLRLLTIAYATSIFILSAIFFVINMQQNKRLENLLFQKKSYLNNLKNVSQDEAKFIYVGRKLNLLDKFIADDVNFYPYYNLLADSLKVSTESATLASFLITKDRAVNFKVGFSNFEDMTGFFSFVESDKFLKNFEELSLDSFTGQSSESRGQQEVSKYELSFEGKFKKLNNESN